MTTNEDNDYSISKADLMEMIRYVVFETVKEIREQEAESISAMQEQEDWEEQNAAGLQQLRTRAAYLAAGLKKLMHCEVKCIDNTDSTELFILSDDLNNGHSIRLELAQVIARKNGGKQSWDYSNRTQYDQAAKAAVFWLKQGTAD